MIGIYYKVFFIISPINEGVFCGFDGLRGVLGVWVLVEVGGIAWEFDDGFVHHGYFFGEELPHVYFGEEGVLLDVLHAIFEHAQAL